MSIPPASPHPTGTARPTKPTHFRRRDFVLDYSTSLLLGAVPSFRAPSRDTSTLDDFILVSQTRSGAPLDRHAGLSCFSHLHQTNDCFAEHIQTLAWLVRRNPGLDGVSLIRLLGTDNAFGLRAALAQLADTWNTRRGAAPGLIDARVRIDRASDARLPTS